MSTMDPAMLEVPDAWVAAHGDRGALRRDSFEDGPSTVFGGFA